MSEANLDLSRYEETVAQHLLFGLARARAFGERVGQNGWQLDLPNGKVEFEGVGALPVQILGTWAHDSDTFLWAWANPGAPSWGPSVGFASQLRDRGQREPGFAVFTQAKISPTWVHPMELGLVVADLINAPLWTVESGQATVLFVIGKAGLEEFVPDAVHLVSLIDVASAFTALSPRSFVEPFLSRLGFTSERSAAETRVARGGTNLLLKWHADGRLLELNGHFGA